MALEPQNVSVTVPVNQAIQHAKRILFSPFDLSKWLSVGFCAWLAYLGQQGFHGSFGGGGRHGNAGNMNVQEWTQRARETITNNLYWIVPVAIAAVVLGLALWIFIVWVSSRGKFMFLHCVALDRAEVVHPWRKFAIEASSLFWFRLILGLMQIGVVFPLAAIIVFLIWRMIQRNAASVAGILGAAVLGLALVLVCLVFWVVSRLTTDFVVPIMFLRGGPCLAAWSILRHLLAANVGGFVIYFLFQILLSMAIGACVLAIVLVTCCIAGCLLAIPYLGTVLFLPVLVFQRAYPVFYLRQYGTEFDVFAPPSGPAQSVC